MNRRNSNVSKIGRSRIYMVGGTRVEFCQPWGDKGGPLQALPAARDPLT